MNFINTGLDDQILKSLDVEHPSEELIKAMNKQGLVQKEVQVRGKNGQTFTRKQWVKASEAKSGTQGTKSSDDSKDTKKKSDKFYKDKYFDQFGNLNITEALKELSRLKYKLVAASEKDANHNRQGYQYVFYNGIDYVTIYRNGGNSNETEKVKVSKTIPSEPKYNFKSYDRVHYPMNNDTAVASTFSHVKNAGLFVQQSAGGQKSKSSEVFNCTKFNTEEQLIDAFDEAINSGENSTSDYDVNKVVVTKIEKYMGNGVKGRGTTPRVRITAEVSGVQNGKSFTKETTLSTLDTTKSSQSSTGQKPSAKNNNIKFDKTKSGKVGGIQIGNELATVVKTVPTGAKKVREVTDKDTGKTYSIYTDVNSNKPDGIVAVENDNTSTSKNSKKTTSGDKSKSFEKYMLYWVNNGSHYQKFDTLDELKQGLKDKGLPESLANLDMKNLDKKSNYVENHYRNYSVIGYPYSDTNSVNSTQKKENSIPKELDDKLEHYGDPSVPHKSEYNGYNIAVAYSGKIRISKDDVEVLSTYSKSNAAEFIMKNKTENSAPVDKKLSPADAKKKTQEITKGISDRKSFMENVKAQGITWKENDHEGINWMRCCMAMNKHFENGGEYDKVRFGSKTKTDLKQASDENEKHNKELVSSDKVKWEVEKKLKDMFYNIPNVKSFRRDDGSISLSFDMDDADGKMITGSTLKKFMKESGMNFDNYDVTATRRKKVGFSSSRSYGYEFRLSITPKSRK